MLPGRRRAPGISKGCSRPADYRIYQPVVGSERRHFRQDNAAHLVAIERQHNARGRPGGPDQRTVSCDGRWADQVNPTFRPKCPSLRLSTPPPAQCTMNASRMMARMITTTQKKNTMMPGMAYPATVLALATATSCPRPSDLFAGCSPGDDDVRSWPFLGRHHMRAAGRRGRSGSARGRAGCLVVGAAGGRLITGAPRHARPRGAARCGWLARI